jgi:hypothetical protein
MLAILLMTALSAMPLAALRPAPAAAAGASTLAAQGPVRPGAPAEAVAPTPPEGRVVEQIVAVVRNPAASPPRPITLTRLVEEARVALVGQGALAAASAPLDPPALRAALRWLVDQWLVAEESARLGVDEVARDELAAEQRRFRERFPDAAAYQRFLEAADLSEEELAVTLARGLRVQRYLDSRVGRSARIGDEELARALAERGLSVEAPGAREAVRARLRDEKAAAQVRQILADLRSRADVRVLAVDLLGGAAP